MSVHAEQIPFEDERLGRHILHDPRSWDHQEELPRKAEPLHDVQHRRYDPYPEPNQPVGCCTFVAECQLANTKGNRVMGEMFTMEDAVRGYSLATSLDPFPGTYPPTDTGSSGLAAAKAAVKLGIAEKYVWYFTMDELLRALQLHPISFGGIWTYDMFRATRSNPVVRATGAVAGGHQWIVSGYRAKEELMVGECWWGKNFGYNGRFYLPVADFRRLYEDRGDAHFTYRKPPEGGKLS